ncbi:MAG TPA: hypothetical protein VM889_12210 [Candidatus Thermoplasmatota archaeon]|nr:hypothetical protein [Candidatus Thermoplasmatota archaeon]
MRAVHVSIEWWSPPANATTTRREVPNERVRKKVESMLAEIAPLLNEYEASLYDMSNLASNGLDYLMPKIELNIPLYEERVSFRLRMIRLDQTQIFLETKKGDAIAEIRLT